MEIFCAVGSVLGKLCYVIKEDKKLTRNLKNDLTYIKDEMAMVNAHIKEAEDKGNIHDPLEEQLILRLQKLAYDIEDSIDTLYQSPKVFFIRRGVSMLTGTDHRPESIDKLKNFKERVITLRDWKSKVATTSSAPSGSPSCTSGTAQLGNQLSQNCCTAGNNHVGIDGPKKEVMDLLLRPEAAADGEAERLRVVCIVGFAGLGKSTLAKAVFDSLDVDERGRRGVDELPPLCRAWVVASEHRDATELLGEIHRQVGGCTSETSSISTLAQLGTYLHSKRYFIVIDDIQKNELWENIKIAFPEKNTSSSSIVVTTRRQSVAKACSSGSYLYKMQPLGRDRSKDLLWQSVDNSCPEPPPALDPGLDGIIDKCDGLPLALLSTARFLRGLPGLDGGKCTHVADKLGDYLAKDDAFADTKRVLAQCYQSLPDYGHKTCLLYASMFPKGHLIKRKSLFRRWSAEGFVVGDGLLTEEDVARNRFDELIDRSFIEPEMGYRVQGVMLEFIVQRTISENFVSLIHNGKLIPDVAGSVRRLSVQHSTKDSARHAMNSIKEQSHIRSLSIAGSDLVDFRRCEVLRVLDLANCSGLTRKVLRKICDLFLLKYLSLRGSDVRKIPRKITKLKLLETLDIRETEVKTLHIEVITLPSLHHLFGEFQLGGDARFISHLFGKFRLHGGPGGARFTSQLHGDARFTSSKLQTLSGLIMDEQGSFAHIINHMRSLRKVKILLKSSPSAESTRLFEGGTDLEHLSIDCGNLSIDFPDCLTAPSKLRSIKLRGKLTSLPNNFLTSINRLSKLHLFSTGLSWQALSGLQKLDNLEYLKLVEDSRVFGDGIFLVREGGFRSLLWLCFEAPKLPRVVFKQGTMASLTDLHLLCPEFADDLRRLGVKGIQHLQRLKEVILHPFLRDSKLENWKRAAIQHINSPYVKMMKKQPINDAEQLMEQ